MSKKGKSKVFFTLIKGASKNATDWAVIDACSLSMTMFGEGSYSHVNTPDGTLFVQRGARKTYDQFTEVIEVAHPGRFVFDYKIK